MQCSCINFADGEAREVRRFYPKFTRSGERLKGTANGSRNLVEGVILERETDEKYVLRNEQALLMRTQVRTHSHQEVQSGGRVEALLTCTIPERASRAYPYGVADE